MRYLAALTLLASAASFANPGLDALAERIASGSTIPHVTIEQYVHHAEQRPVFLFDVRTPEEYAVSHLAGAVRLDPDMAPEAFLARYGERLQTGEVIFYCSVGRRATRLAESVAAAQRTRGQSAVPANLRGGIFAWHNNRLPLVRNDHPTDEVHPASWVWKRYLDRPELARYRADP